MTTVKHLFISLFVLFGYTTGAWAIEQDSDGYYLIGSVQDWKDFASLVLNTNQGANARMTANIDLGDDQTHIGSSVISRYHGVFDGGGYTLTVNYVSSDYGLSPFRYTNGATIKNLHVDGSIVSTYSREPHTSGVISHSRGDDLIENVWVSVDMQSGGSGWLECAAFIGCNNSGNSRIINCLFTGSLTTTSGYYNGCFFGYADSGNVTITNCLSTGSFNYYGGSNSATRGIVDNSYVLHFPATIPESMQVTDEQLADGTIAAALGDAWVQDPLTHQPMLKIFATLKQDSEGYYLIGSVTDWRRFAELVNSGTNPAANARMVRDVDLGDDQTTIGICAVKHSEYSENKPYSGIFDGQGHTLTINYTSESSGSKYVAVFPYARGLTIKNLHIDGSVTVTNGSTSGIISFHRGEGNVMENVWSSLNVTSTETAWSCSAAFVASSWQNGQPNYLVVKDCLFTGSLNDPQGDYDGCFLGWIESGSATFENCLTLGSFDLGSYSAISKGSNMTITNCYIKQFPLTIPENMSITDEQIADGTLTTNLQNNREEEIWVQDPELGIPMLKIFANEETEQTSDVLNGVFTINASGEKVSFAKGNLQKIGSTYQFAEHQYDYFGTDQSDTHRDMYAFLDYSNPDNGESWSMLSNSEWKYLFATRSVTNTLSDGARYTMATLGGTYKGLIIFPDYYTHPEGADFTPGVFDSNSNYTAQVSLEGWAMMEAAGCVFLPAAGYCSSGRTWRGVGEYVCYMSTTPDGSWYYDPYFRPDGVYLDETSLKETWSSIRLVLRLPFLTYTVPASGVGTFSSEVNIHLPEGLNAHYCKTYYAERSAISVEDISSGVVPANTGVLLSGTPGETFNLYRTHETADELEGNALVAVPESTHINATDGAYTNFMMKGGKFIRIADESEDVKMPANRAYLPLLTADISGSNAKEIMLLWDDKEATGIESLTPGPSPMGEESIYNLNGQKLSSPLKGINIINGRKVIVK